MAEGLFRLLNLKGKPLACTPESCTHFGRETGVTCRYLKEMSNARIVGWYPGNTGLSMPKAMTG